jgi:5'-nucleotidase
MNSWLLAAASNFWFTFNLSHFGISPFSFLRLKFSCAQPILWISAMHILVTNDDGINAPGLFALTQAMRTLAETLDPLGQVSVLAPDHNWSASGHVKTLERPLRVKEALLKDSSRALATDGAPSDCVALAILGLLPEPVDLVVAGINAGPNLGHDLTYSGTVTAAMEAAIWGLPAAAFSLDIPEKPAGALDFEPAARVAAQVVANLIQNGIPKGTLLSVNVPYLPFEQIRGTRITRQGLRIYRDELVRRADPRGRPYYWIGGEAPSGKIEEGTDIGALHDGYVSVTPICLDLTAHGLISTLEGWQW